MQNHNCQVVTIPLLQIRQLFLGLGKCSPVISVHLSLNPGLRRLNKLKQFTTIAKLQKGGGIVQQNSSVLGKQIGFLDLNQILVLKKHCNYAGISHTLCKKKKQHTPKKPKKPQTTQGNCALSSFLLILIRNFGGYERHRAHVGEESMYLLWDRTSKTIS